MTILWSFFLGVFMKKIKSAGKYIFEGEIIEVPEKGGAYIIFPWNIRDEFKKERVKVNVTFDGVPYSGSIVNMGIKDKYGNPCYIIGILKSIRKELNKKEGDMVKVVVEEVK